MRPGSILLALALGAGVLAEPAAAQTRPRVFLDCSGPNCNGQYYRTEIDWVNWVNDPAVADVHVIMGSVSSGAGGREYQLDFLGVDASEGYVDQLVYRQLSTDTERESLDGLTHTLGLGLARWADAHGYRGLVRLEAVGAFEEGEAGAPTRLVSQDEVDDPWNLWVFRFNANVDRDSEETQSDLRINGGFNASRVTPTWKLNFNVFVNHNRIRRELSSGPFHDRRTDWRFNQLVAYSVADHWSIGVSGTVGRRNDENQDLEVRVTPAVEFSFFPYEEATRRSLTAFYTIGPTYFEYADTTIYGRIDELRYLHSLEVDFSSRQPWGDAGVRIRLSHYLHDIDVNSRSLEGDVNYRITRGVSVFARGDITWVNDQIYLPAEEASDEEALLNLQRQATDQESSLSVGLRLQFGSIFNNVVNNRFRGVGGN